MVGNLNSSFYTVLTILYLHNGTCCILSSLKKVASSVDGQAPLRNYQRRHYHIFQNSDFCQKHGIHSKITHNKFKYSRTRLKRHRFKRHLVYNVRRSVVPNNPSLLTITLHFSVITRLVYNDTNILFGTL